MKINLSKKDIEYILYLINEFGDKDIENSDDSSFDMDLADKLETALREIAGKDFEIKMFSKNRLLN